LRYGAHPLLVIPLDEPVTIAHETIAPGDCGLANNLEMIRFHGGKSLITQPL
jgi:DNA-directed RNA polymerase subunit K/omega